MSDRRLPAVGLCSNQTVRQEYVAAGDLERLGGFARFDWREMDLESSWDGPPAATVREVRGLTDWAKGLDALVVCHGSPRVTAEVLNECPKLRFVGELEGDRFARRIDVDACASRGVRAVDTTQGSSYPVSEWALAMMLVGLRNAGGQFRRLIEHRPAPSDEERRRDPGYVRGELTGKTVGLIGCGHIGRRLLEYLEPFHVCVLVHDPYIPKEIADAYRFTLTSLDNVLAIPDVVVCLAPLTPGTRRMIGAREIGLLKPGAVFVNVSRGAIVDSAALIERLRMGDIVASLDVFDPEPVPVDSPVRDLPNVFLTPHIAGVTAASRTRFFTLMVDELKRFFGGHETLYDLTPRTMANRRGAPPGAR
jgi:phosphoglycerate dehydrogenase-like enzyme